MAGSRPPGVGRPPRERRIVPRRRCGNDLVALAQSLHGASRFVTYSVFRSLSSAAWIAIFVSACVAQVERDEAAEEKSTASVSIPVSYACIDGACVAILAKSVGGIALIGSVLALGHQAGVENEKRWSWQLWERTRHAFRRIADSAGAANVNYYRTTLVVSRGLVNPTKVRFTSYFAIAHEELGLHVGLLDTSKRLVAQMCNLVTSQEPLLCGFEARPVTESMSPGSWFAERAQKNDASGVVEEGLELNAVVGLAFRGEQNLAVRATTGPQKPADLLVQKATEGLDLSKAGRRACFKMRGIVNYLRRTLLRIGVPRRVTEKALLRVWNRASRIMREKYNILCPPYQPLEPLCAPPINHKTDRSGSVCGEGSGAALGTTSR